MCKASFFRCATCTNIHEVYEETCPDRRCNPKWTFDPSEDKICPRCVEKAEFLALKQLREQMDEETAEAVEKMVGKRKEGEQEEGKKGEDKEKGKGKEKQEG